MSRLSEIIILILQFLKEHNLKETIHILEQESGVFFNMKHFEEAVLAGEWEKAERYLSGFTKLDDNQISKKIFFMIRRNKYIETLQRHDVSKACEILMKDLKVFSEVDEGLFKELTQLLTLEDFREKAKLSKYIDTRSARILAINELRKLIKANPLFEDILQFPDMKESRLKTLLNQSLHWQHMRCKNPRSQPEFKSLFFDHSCPQASEAIMPSPAPPPIKLTSKSSPSPMNPIAKPTTMNMTAKPVPSWLNLVANPVLPTMNPIAKPSPQIEKISPPPMNPIAKPAPRPMKVNSKHACPTMNLTAKPVPLMKLPMNPTAKLSGFPLIRPPEPAADDGSTKVAAEIPSRMAPYRTSCEFTGQGPVWSNHYLRMSHSEIYDAVPGLVSDTLSGSDVPPNACQVRSNPPPLVPCQAISDAVRDAVSDIHTGPNVPPNACQVPSNAPPPKPRPAISAADFDKPIELDVPPITASLLKHPTTQAKSIPAACYLSTDPDHGLKKRGPKGKSDEILSERRANIQQNPCSIKELPRKVLFVLKQGSSVTSMDFHPSQNSILLVGTSVGDIAVWDVSLSKRLAHRAPKVWELPACSKIIQLISVKRVLWDADGSQFGVAYSERLMHLYKYKSSELVNHLEIDAHAGGVNDIAFSQPNKKSCVVTCGDDKLIKVWDTITGDLQYTFEGHEAPVYSICSHSKENIPFILSVSLDGEVKIWQYGNECSQFDYTAPGRWCTTMAYSADGTRLFSCGTSKEGDSYIVEWDENKGSVKQSFVGSRRSSLGVVQFDTTKNRFLAAGDDFMIKFWDMDNINLLATTDALGGLTACPRIRFNKLGSFLAVSTCGNSIKILANDDGFQEAIAKTSSIRSPATVSAMVGTNSAAPDGSAPMTSIVRLQNVNSQSVEDVKSRIVHKSIEKSKNWKLIEISEHSQCCSLKLTDNILSVKVARLLYTNSGTGVLALTCNAIHKLWKWPKTDRNATGKATAQVAPQLWLPASGILMTNEMSDANPQEAVHCFALSKNDSYVVSASGAEISLFNMLTFKTMITFKPPPPAATFLAFHPQDNNIIAIGMDDYSIEIYHAQSSKVKRKLRGHQKSITGLAFSIALDVLISSGADAQLCVWGVDGWQKQAGKFLQTRSGRAAGAHAETHVQFHHDQIHFLVVHETQLAIYEARKLECIEQWFPRGESIAHAAYSCDSQMIYASFTNGTVAVFTSALRLRCRIKPRAYLNQQSSDVHPAVVAAHPSKPYQFALGLTDGSVHILEPLESEGKWMPESSPENPAYDHSSKR